MGITTASSTLSPLTSYKELRDASSDSTDHVPSSPLPGPTRQGSVHEPSEDMTGFVASMGVAASQLLQENDGTNEWDRLVKFLLGNDDTLIDRATKGIDSLLILTGLLSAVVGGFALESYRSLGPDPATQTVHLLEQLVLQSNGIVHIQNQSATTSLSPKLITLVNVFWYLSLLFTLITASLGVFVKQWLQRYLNWQCTSTQERLRVRHIRYKGLMRFKVLQLAELLPILLQFALMLFLTGLVLFLIPVNVVVGWAVLAGVIIWGIVLILIFIIPFLFDDCPYHLSLVRSLSEPIKARVARILHGENWSSHYGYENPYYRFPGDERGIRREARLGLDAIISADASLMDNDILRNTMLACVKTFTIGSALTFSREMLSHRLERPIASLYEVKKEEYQLFPTAVLDVLLAIFCRYLDTTLDDIQEHYAESLEMTASMYIAASCISSTDRNSYLTALSWDDVCDILRSSPIRACLLQPIELDDPFYVRVSDCRDALMVLMVLVDDVKMEATLDEPVENIQTLLQIATLWLPKLEQVAKITLTRSVFGYMTTVHPETLELPGWSPHLSAFFSAWRETPVSVIGHDSEELHDLVDILRIASNLNDKTSQAFISKEMIDLIDSILPKAAQNGRQVVDHNTQSVPNTAQDSPDTSPATSAETLVSSYSIASARDDDDAAPRTSTGPASVSGRSTPSSVSLPHSGNYVKNKPGHVTLHGQSSSDPIYHTPPKGVSPRSAYYSSYNRMALKEV